MAKKYCPDWLYNLAVARAAYEFIISELPIKAYAKKYASGLSEHYEEIKTEEVENEAELILRFLVEINAEKSDDLLNNYVYFCFKYVQHGQKRKLKGIFGTAFDPTKEKKYNEKFTLKSFRAYVFGIRSGISEKPSAGWNILEEDGLEFLKNIVEKEANIVDAV